jgi:hypothetical protein
MVGNVVLEEFRRLVRHVEEHAVEAVAFHLEVDGAGHDVTRCQFRAAVVVGHEARAVGQAQQASLAAQSLRNQEGLGVRMVEAGRVELDELHVGHAATGAPCDRHAVAGGRIGVGGVEIHLAGAAGSHCRVAGAQRQHAVAGDVQHIGAKAAVARQAEFGRGDQVDRNVPFEDGDVGMHPHLFGQRLLHRGAGGIGGVNDPALAMAAFARQMEAEGRIVRRERNPARDQPFDGRATVLDDEARRGRVAQSGAGNECVVAMGIDRICRVEYCGDPALRPGRGRVRQRFFGHQRHPAAAGKPQSQGLAGQAAADDEDVEMLDGGRIHGAGLYHRRRDGTICTGFGHCRQWLP